MLELELTERSNRALAKSRTRIREEGRDGRERGGLEGGVGADGGLEAGEDVGEEVQRVDEKLGGGRRLTRES